MGSPCAARSGAHAGWVPESAGLGEVTESVGNLDKITRENAALVEMSASASSTLVERAQALREAVVSMRLRQASADEAHDLAEKALAHIAAVGREKAFAAQGCLPQPNAVAMFAPDPAKHSGRWRWHRRSLAQPASFAQYCARWKIAFQPGYRPVLHGRPEPPDSRLAASESAFAMHGQLAEHRGWRSMPVHLVAPAKAAQTGF